MNTPVGYFEVVEDLADPTEVDGGFMKHDQDVIETTAHGDSVRVHYRLKGNASRKSRFRSKSTDSEIEVGMRILIADDSTVSRHLLERTLTRWGYEVISCADGTEAWEQLQLESAPQLVILDWMMPGYSGPELCNMVRQMGREPYSYVLLLSSRSLKEDLVEGMDAGADDYVTKPFDHHELKARLRAGRRILTLQEQLMAAREALREQAMRDSLTRLWNRSSILDMLERERNRAIRQATALAVIMLDLDHFKAINDTYGHLAGDAVLKETGRRLLAMTRPYDGVGRYGGEEFLVLLPGCDEQALEARTEQLRLAVSSEPIRAGDTELTVTASFGATLLLPDLEAEPTALIKIADDALYEAKAHGRNRVVCKTASPVADSPVIKSAATPPVCAEP
jgi:two-component system, cell cycle response regulator